MRERVCLLGEQRSLVGVLGEPEDACRKPTAFLLLNSGLVPRAGPQRLYVKLARALSAAGLATLRFDFAGIGDSPARRDHLPFDESAPEETLAAMDGMERELGVRRFVLGGLCSGATQALRAAARDERVVGAALVNLPCPQDASEDEVQRTLEHHFRRLALSRSLGTHSLGKLLRGRFDRGLVGAVLKRGLRRRRVAPSAATERTLAELEAVLSRGARILCVHAEADEGLDYHRVFLRDRLARRPDRVPDRTTIRGANHTFTLLEHQEELLEAVRRWVETVVN